MDIIYDQAIFGKLTINNGGVNQQQLRFNYQTMFFLAI